MTVLLTRFHIRTLKYYSADTKVLVGLSNIIQIISYTFHINIEILLFQDSGPSLEFSGILQGLQLPCWISDEPCQEMYSILSTKLRLASTNPGWRGKLLELNSFRNENVHTFEWSFGTSCRREN